MGLTLSRQISGYGFKKLKKHKKHNKVKSKNDMKRESWNSKLGFILAASGSAVGLGNLWKFPYETYNNGGSAFIFIYLISIVLVGLPIMMAEIFIGKSTNKNPIGAFKALHPSAWHIIGWLGIASGFVILSFYSVVGGWTLRYFAATVSGAFLDMDKKMVAQDFVHFLQTGSLQIFFHSLFIFFVIGIVFGGVQKGIELAGKVFMPILFVLLISLVIFSMQTPGLAKTIDFLFSPDWSQVTGKSILEAVGQSFFSLSLGMGAIITYGSYMDKNEPILKDAVTIVSFDTLIAFLACFMIFPILFSFDLQPTESVGILFSTLPVIFLQMPGGFIVGPLFFLLIIFAALSSAISLLEVVVSYFIDEKQWPRRKATIVLGFAIWLLGIPSALSLGGWQWFANLKIIGERNFFDSLDFLASNWMLPVGGIFIAIFTGWIVSKDTRNTSFAKDHQGTYKSLIFILRYVTPILVFLVLLSSIGILD